MQVAVLTFVHRIALIVREWAAVTGLVSRLVVAIWALWA